jgi:hypothetical protein
MQEIMIQFIRRQADCVETAIKSMVSGMIDVKNMATHSFPLVQISFQSGCMKRQQITMQQ